MNRAVQRLSSVRTREIGMGKAVHRLVGEGI